MKTRHVAVISVVVLPILFLTAARPAAGEGPTTAPARQGVAVASPAVSPEKVPELVKQLGSDQYKTRDQAEKQLVEIGPPAVEALTAAAKSDDAEVRTRAERALTAIRDKTADAASAAVQAAQLWKFPLKTGAATAPLLVKDLGVVVSADGTVSAVDLKTGKVIWTLPSDGRGGHQRLAAGSGLVHILSPDNLRAVDAATGEAKWEGKAAGSGTALALAGKVVCVASVSPGAAPQQELAAFDAATGKGAWSMEVKDGITMPPVASGELILYGTGTRLVARQADTGQEKWSLDCKEGFLAAPAAKDGVVYVGALSGNAPGLMAVDAATGVEKWNCQFAPPPEAAAFPAVKTMISRFGPAPVDGICLAGDTALLTHDCCLYAVDLVAQKQKWTFVPKAPQDPNAAPGAPGQVIVNRGAKVMISTDGGQGPSSLSAPVAGEGAIYVCSGQGLHALDPKTGQELWRFATKEPAAFPPAVAGNILCFATRLGAAAAGGNVQVRMVVEIGGAGGGVMVMNNGAAGGAPAQPSEPGLYGLDLSKIKPPARPKRISNTDQRTPN